MGVDASHTNNVNLMTVVLATLCEVTVIMYSVHCILFGYKLIEEISVWCDEVIPGND